MSYEWTATGGTISGIGNTVSWIAPSVTGIFSINVTVNNGIGGVISESIAVEVEGPTPTPTPTPTEEQPVYSGLNSARASMEAAGGVKALGNTSTSHVTFITFQIHSVLADDSIDMSKTLITYTDASVYDSNVSYSFSDQKTGSTTTLGPYDIGQITIDIASVSPTTTLGPYGTFTIELIPATGATVTVQRTLPGEIDAVMDLH